MSNAAAPALSVLRRLAAPPLRPGLHLMRQMRMPAKLALMLGLLLLPLGGLMLVSVQDILQHRASTGRELQGASLAGQLMPVTLQAQRHRGLTHRVLLGDAAASAERDAAASALGGALAGLDAPLREFADESLQQAWEPLKREIAGLVERSRRGGAADAAALFAAHSDAIEQLRGLGRLAAEHSGLDRDVDLGAHHLANLVVSQLPSVLESAASMRGRGAGVLAAHVAGGADNVEDRAAVLGRRGQVRNALVDLGLSFDALERSGIAAPASWAGARAALQALDEETARAFAGREPQGNAGAYFDLGTRAVEQTAALQRDTLALLQTSLTERQAALQRQLWAQLGGFGALLALLLYTLTCFTLLFRDSLAALRRGTEAIAQGNLAQPVELAGRDELADIGRIVDRMSEGLSALVSEIRNSASLVNQTGQQISDGSTRLAARTDEQADRLRSSVEAIQQLSQAVSQNADAARTLDALTERLAERAGEGHAAMGETVQAMARMRSASDQVAEIVSVIDSVSFQTRMLSLNAAIEAARAGEAGKGFAVVAAEVRQLAQRCAHAADEIRVLIGNARDQVGVSSDKLQNVGGVLDVVVDGVQQVSLQLRSISTSSTQQSAGLQDVTRNVGDLDEITRNNASLVEESSSASGALVDRAARLRAAVASMRLRQGSADEAMAMVQVAEERLQRLGRSAAFEDFHRDRAAFVDRDMYLFVLAADGRYLVHAAKPQNAGQNVLALPGIDPQSMQRCLAAAADGGGWVQYEILNPLTGDVSKKESWVRDAGDGCVLGCGVYRQESAVRAISAAPSPVSAAATRPAAAAAPAPQREPALA